MRAFWRNYNLSIVLFALFMTSWVLQGVAQWFEMANEAQAHGEASTLAEWVPAFLAATFEDWQSEFLQLLTFVVLTSFLIHKGSHESKDSDDELKATLGRIEERLKRLERGEAWPRVTNGRATNGHGTSGHGTNGHAGPAHSETEARERVPAAAAYSAPNRP